LCAHIRKNAFTQLKMGGRKKEDPYCLPSWGFLHSYSQKKKKEMAGMKSADQKKKEEGMRRSLPVRGMKRKNLCPVAKRERGHCVIQTTCYREEEGEKGELRPFRYMIQKPERQF